MPDPVLYIQAMGIAAIASALGVLAMVWLHRRANSTDVNRAGILAVGVGLLLGYRALQLRFVWPPTNGLDRLLVVVFPIAITIEYIAGLPQVRRVAGWCLRLCFAAVAGRILLHGSVYLNGSPGSWTTIQAAAVLIGSGVILISVWWLLVTLAERRPGVSIPLSVAAAVLAASLTIMLAGYVTGGAAALPLFAATVAAVLTARLVAPGRPVSGMIGIAVVGLFSLLYIGRFFGAVSSVRASVVLTAPLLCWITELPILRGRSPRQQGIIRLIAVTISLITVVLLEKRDFDRETAPLLTQVTRSTTSVEPISVGSTSG